jgi:hypothetical protein
LAEAILLELVQRLATLAGLSYPDVVLQRLLPGVNRTRKQAAALRELLADAAEPVPTFKALKHAKVYLP